MNILLAVGFGLLLVILFRGFLFDSSLLMLNSDQLNGLGSHYLRIHDLIVTQWDDSRLGGIPTLDALFGAALHPLVLTQWIMDPARAVGFKFILCVYIAFLSAYALFRKVTGRWEWAALLGFLYALNPQFFTHIYGGHDGKMMVFSVAPLAVLGIILIMRERRFSGLVLLTLSVLWMVVSSHLQLTYFFLWGAGLFTLYEAFRIKLSAKERTIRLGLAAAGLALALGMGSFQIIPPYMYTTQQSVRGSGEKTTIGHAVSWSLHQEELASMLVPGFLGMDVEQERAYWGHNSFKLNHDAAGTLLTFLAFLGLFVASNRRAAIFWFLGSTVALSYALGAHSPLFGLWYAILPGVKNFRAPSMAIFWIPLAMTMMAAPVLDALTDKKKREKLIPGMALFASLVAIVVIARFTWESMLGVPGIAVSMVFGACVVATLNLQDRGESFSPSNLINAWTSGLKGSNKVEMGLVLLPFIFVAIVMASGQNLVSDPATGQYFQRINTQLMTSSASQGLISGIIVLITASVAFWVVASRPLWLAAGILVLVASVDLYLIDSPFIQNVSMKSYIQPDNQIVQLLRSDSPDSLQFPRLLSVSRNPALSGNVFPAYGMRNALGSHDNELASYREFRGGQESSNFLVNVENNPFLNLLNIGYVIFDTPQGTQVQRNPGALPYVSLYGSYKIVPHDSVIPLLKQDWDYRLAMLLEVSPTGLPNEAKWNETTGPRKISGTAKLVSSPKMDTQIFEVKSDGPALMLVSGNYHPYWKASIDGSPTPVIKAFGTLRAVVVPAGTHTVEMKYRSDMVALSMKIAGISLALFLVSFLLALFLHFLRKRGTPT